MNLAIADVTRAEAGRNDVEMLDRDDYQAALTWMAGDGSIVILGPDIVGAFRKDGRLYPIRRDHSVEQVGEILEAHFPLW